MNKHHDITESIIYINELKEPEPQRSIFHICCRISENQPIAKLVMYDVTFPDTAEPCALKISKKNFRIIMLWVSMPTHVMAHLMESISQATAVDHMEIDQTSLAGVKSFNLENKAASLLDFSLHKVKMDPELCTSLMKQIPSLINLKFLTINPRYEYWQIPTDLCPKIIIFLISLSSSGLPGCFFQQFIRVFTQLSFRL